VVEIAVELAISHARKSIEGSLFAFAESSYGHFLDFSIKFRDGRVSFINQLILHQLILSSLFVESEGFEAIFEHVEIQVLDQGTRRNHLSHHILAVSSRIFPALPELAQSLESDTTRLGRGCAQLMERDGEELVCGVLILKHMETNCLTQF
jgi:hypothetical protein